MEELNYESSYCLYLLLLRFTLGHQDSKIFPLNGFVVLLSRDWTENYCDIKGDLDVKRDNKEYINQACLQRYGLNVAYLHNVIILL